MLPSFHSDLFVISFIGSFTYSLRVLLNITGTVFPLRYRTQMLARAALSVLRTQRQILPEAGPRGLGVTEETKAGENGFF